MIMTNVEKTKRLNGDAASLAAGVLSLFFFVMLAVYHIRNNESYHILWTCHMACLVLGAGLMFNRPLVTATGFFWLCFGVPLWLLNVLTGSPLILLSVPTHIGGLLIGLWGVKRGGIPKYTWVFAGVSLIVLGVVSRFVTPFDANVNLSHAIWKGYEAYYPSYVVYVASVSTSGVATFFFLEWAAGFLARFIDNKKTVEEPA